MKKTLYALIMCSLVLHICVFNSFCFVEHKIMNHEAQGGLDTSDSHAHEDDMGSGDEIFPSVLVNPVFRVLGSHISGRACALNPLLPPPKSN